eukprot:COSAG02_NODE_55214_length_291_cov_3.963542_1_plen_22_part_10
MVLNDLLIHDGLLVCVWDWRGL